jgi:hypothetical protein
MGSRVARTGPPPRPPEEVVVPDGCRRDVGGGRPIRTNLEAPAPRATGASCVASGTQEWTP